MATSRAVVREIPGDAFTTEVLERSREVPVIVDFWAPWCAPCQVLGPALERAVVAQGGAVELAKIDVDQAQQLAQQLGISGIPTVRAYRDGQVAAEFVGAQPPDVIEGWVRSLVPSEGERTVAEARKANEAGQPQRAIDLLSGQLERDPRDNAAKLELGRVLARRDRLSEAAEVLAQVERGAAEEDEARRERLLIEMALEGAGKDPDALLERARSQPDDPAPRFAAAGALWRAGRSAEAIEPLLEVVGLDRRYRDDAARKALLALFDELGHEHPEVQAGRRRLATLLY
jgi:putative thioredoxin